MAYVRLKQRSQEGKSKKACTERSRSEKVKLKPWTKSRSAGRKKEKIREKPVLLASEGGLDDSMST
jgi:hypothetical protein